MASDSTTLTSQIDKLNVNDSASTSDTTSSELVATVDDLLNQLSTKFSTVSSELIAKMDDMSRRLDNLEATIQAGNASNGSEGEK